MGSLSASETVVIWKREKRERMLESAFRLFSEKGIEMTCMPEIAEASGIGRATLYRYYPTKADLVVAVSSHVWEKYFASLPGLASPEYIAGLTLEDFLVKYLDSFLNLYRNHKDLLRFNYNLNSFLLHENVSEEQRAPFVATLDRLRNLFRGVYGEWLQKGTVSPAPQAGNLFFGSCHIMLSAVTRFSTGLVYLAEPGADPEEELIMLRDLLLEKMIRVLSPDPSPEKGGTQANIKGTETAISGTETTNNGNNE